MPELLGCRLDVALVTQVACVLVDVEPAEARVERHGVVDHRGKPRAADREAALA